MLPEIGNFLHGFFENFHLLILISNWVLKFFYCILNTGHIFLHNRKALANLLDFLGNHLLDFIYDLMIIECFLRGLLHFLRHSILDILNWPCQFCRSFSIWGGSQFVRIHTWLSCLRRLIHVIRASKVWKWWNQWLYCLRLFRLCVH